MKRGLFISFEGPEGAGKSTHARALARWLRRRGYSVLLTREPGGTALGNRLRRILLSSREDSVTPLVELLLVEAARCALVSQVVRPALRAGKIVVVDRFQDSTWVYQGWAGGVPRRLVEEIGRAATAGLKPDRTILLDLPVRRGLLRVRRPNRMEARPKAFHERVRRGYLALARRDRRRIRLIRADRPIREVQRKVREVLQDVLG